MTETPQAAPSLAITMETVAREAGVSRATVSLVYRGAKGPSRASVEKVLAAGARIGYRPNALAARLASKRTNTLGLTILDLANEVFVQIAEGVRDTLAGTDQKLVLAAARPEQGDELDAVEGLLGTRVDAAIVSGSMLSDEQLTMLAASTPFVIISRLVPGLDSVASDDRQGGTLATQHLIELGHRSIVHLIPPVASHYSGRGDGYSASMRAAGLTPRTVDTGFSINDATATATQLLRSAERPTAIFANNDIAALGVLTAAASLGIAVPAELSVIGYDNTRAAALPGVALTSVDQQARRLGQLGAEYALAALDSDGAAVADAAAGATAGAGSKRCRIRRRAIRPTRLCPQAHASPDLARTITLPARLDGPARRPQDPAEPLSQRIRRGAHPLG